MCCEIKPFYRKHRKLAIMATNSASTPNKAISKIRIDTLY